MPMHLIKVTSVKTVKRKQPKIFILEGTLVFKIQEARGKTEPFPRAGQIGDA